MKRISLFVLFTLLCIAGNAQEEKSPFGIKFSGFVKNDFIYDTRQTVAAREGHFLLWPKAFQGDVNDVDINDHPNFNFLAIQSRLTGKISGPDALGAKTSGVIEGAFFGHSDADVNGFRLRHAYGKLRWENAELLFGQTWHPMFITGCFPGVISFNTGAPFQPFSRNPQVRFTYFMGNLSIVGTAFAQRDFTSAGGSALLRNSGMPEYNLNFSYHHINDTGSEILAGFNAGYKTLVPRLVTENNEVTDDKVSSFAQEVYFKVKIPAITFKLEAIYGQNMYDVLGISSFALTHKHPITDLRDYIPLNQMSVWSEIHTNGQKFQVGLFGGYTKNLGTYDMKVMEDTFGSRSNIDYVYRIAPRLVYNAGKVRFAAEVEYTAAAFGEFNSSGAVSNSVEVANTRFLLAAYYFF